MLTFERMTALLVEHMASNGITQAELARRLGRTPKHVNQVIHGKSGTGELDYWAYVLGLRFDVSLAPAKQDITDCPVS